MRAEPLTRWFAAGVLIVGLAFVLSPAVAAEDAKDIQKQERRLQADAKKLDADAARASSTSEGQRHLDERLVKQFNVDPSVVSGLRARGFSHGQMTIALALSQEVMKKDSTLSQQAAVDKIVADRQAGKGWGVIAHQYGLKLGHVISEVKKADKAAEHIASKPDTKVVKTDKPEKFDKPEKPEKPAKPEKPGR
jgi:hypothetical protein